MQCDRRLDLVGDDLGDQLAADREVRVGEVVHLRREHFGDAVGPPAVAARMCGVGVADASVNESPIATKRRHGCAVSLGT